MSRVKMFIGESILTMGGVYLFYYIVGFAYITTWNYGLRNALAGILILFLAQVATGAALHEKLWRAALIPFYLWIVVFGYVQTVSAGGWSLGIEKMNNYFLTALSASVFISLLLFWKSRWSVVNHILEIIGWGLSSLFFIIAMTYLGYYMIFDTGFTSADMITILLTNKKEALKFFQSHLGGWMILAVLVVACGLWGIWRLNSHASLCSMSSGNNVKYRKILQGVLCIAALITIAHWFPRVFPMWDLHVAKKYLAQVDKIKDSRTDDLKNFSLSIPETETLAHQLPGTVIVVVGESANRDHLKAFNEAYPAETTPWLSQKKDDENFYLFRNAYSNYPLTAQSLSMFLTGNNQYNGNGVKKLISVIDLANKAGYETYWFSNQDESGNAFYQLWEKARHITSS